MSKALCINILEHFEIVTGQSRAFRYVFLILLHEQVQAEILIPCIFKKGTFSHLLSVFNPR